MSLKNSFNPQKILEKLITRHAEKSPRHFRNALTISSDDKISFKKKCQSWQKKDFEALDAAWRKLAGQKVKPRFQRAYIERPRGHSKTSDMAIQLAWIIQNAPTQLSGLVAAADREQASLIWEAIRKIATLNPRFCSELEFRKHLVINRQTGTQLDIISSDVSSSWGALPDFVICDELCHWEKDDMWHSLLSSAAKRPNSVLAVLTNAGFGRGWQWQVREAARQSHLWYFSSLDGTQAPWIHPDWLTEQEELLPRPVYERLWLNRWQHSDGSSDLSSSSGSSSSLVSSSSGEESSSEGETSSTSGGSTESGPGTGDLLLKDLFTDTSSNIYTHLMDIGESGTDTIGWGSFGGSWTLYAPADILVGGVATGDGHIQADAGQSNMEAFADIRLGIPVEGGRADAGLQCSCNSEGDFGWLLWLDATWNLVYLYEWGNGTGIIRDSESVTLDYGSIYSARLKVNGTSIEAEVAGVTLSYTAASAPVNTFAGFRIYELRPGGSPPTGAIWFDNFYVYDV